MSKRSVLLSGLLAWTCSLIVLMAEGSPGIPVTDPLVRSSCGGCHPSDEQQRLSRISYQRKTVEGWQITLKRMIRSGYVSLNPEDARRVIRYLGDHHGLAPDEARPYFYRAEKRPQLETFEDLEIKETCIACHLGAWFASQRRTPQEWTYLKGMHLGYFPKVEFQTFRGKSKDEKGEKLEGWQVDRVLDKLAERFPFDSREWKEYQAKRVSRGIGGRWLFISHQPGKGPVTGVITMEPRGQNYQYSGEFLTADGSRHQREGEGVLYGAYSWRGRSSGSGLGELREVLLLSEDGSKLTGRFFSGTYGETGFDVVLERLGGDPRLMGVWPRSARIGSGRQRVRILGANLPQDVAPDMLDMGQGIQIERIVSSSSTAIEIEIQVQGDAIPGYRNLAMPAAQVSNVFAIHDGVDYVRVVPGESLARVGSIRVPKQMARFEAIAFDRGADDEPLTDDDLNLGTVQANWSLEEYFIRPEDDDVPYVGEIDENGLFTPASDGPNFTRPLNADNIGDVWVVASYRAKGASEPLKGRARLVVTVPVFVYWDLFP